MSLARLTVALFTVLVGLAVVTSAQQTSTLDPVELRQAIARGLRQAPRGFAPLTAPEQAGVRVLDVRVDRTSRSSQRVTIDLSQKVITYDPSGDTELILDQVLRATAPLTGGVGDVEYRFLVDGLPLEAFLSRPVPRVTARSATNPRVLISAGHGWYWNEHFGAWHLQRDHFWGIVEDEVNWEFAAGVQSALRGTRFDARLARNPDRFSAPGVSGHPGWQEGAVYFIRGMGAPHEIWNIGVNDYARDINTRPLYANWIDVDMVVSIHNNGGGGTGTETWYDETNGYQGESRRLADALNSRIVTAIRRFYNPQWPDRGLRSCNGCKGENRLALRPAVILEIAFMDTRSPDNDALHDPRFRQIVSYGISDGLHAFAGLPPPRDD
jgi:N-acetylmuramoyl-L-alanine amidase